MLSEAEEVGSQGGEYSRWTKGELARAKLREVNYTMILPAFVSESSARW